MGDIVRVNRGWREDWLREVGDVVRDGDEVVGVLNIEGEEKVLGGGRGKKVFGVGVGG